ncbi:MAG: RsmD family RNA methyltransferase [Planctomycetota bacterium]|nr:RsmD family RNA methyltransferase [Planctomycetota bacterium]
MAKAKKERTRKGRDLDKWRNTRPAAPAGSVRIIGGQYRGQTLLYSGDKITRPMKDNVREALFNLVGGYLEDTVVFDLFAGTGAVGLEALSRHAFHSVLIERHVPTSRIIRQNAESIDVMGDVSICCSDTFFWVRQFAREIDSGNVQSIQLDLPSLQQRPWVVFCCPPYDSYLNEEAKLLPMLEFFCHHCPPQSLIVVECDDRFDLGLLPAPDQWKTTRYSPAIISILKFMGQQAHETQEKGSLIDSHLEEME